MGQPMGGGLLEITRKGFGFLRVKGNIEQDRDDLFVSQDLIRRFRLKAGLWIDGPTRSGGNNRGPQLIKPEKINGHDPQSFTRLKPFDQLTSINPDQKITFETTPDRLTTRTVDLLCPVGMGQRGLIVAPPRTGKTVLLQHMADGITKNHPDLKLIVLLVDERPEEVTDMKRSVQGEVFASTNDMQHESHTRLANLVIEKAKRMVEFGHDVIILMDSLTRLGRAFNLAVGSSGKTLSGGVDANALERPKRIFGAARKAEEGGSLTIIATALIDTGSRMDEYIFQEFKGTGNMEMVLDRNLADRRIWPAMDINQSGTRKEELLMDPKDLQKINTLRRKLVDYKPIEAMEMLQKIFAEVKTNKELLESL